MDSLSTKTRERLQQEDRPETATGEKCNNTHSTTASPNHGQCDLLKDHMGSHHCGNCDAWY